MSTFLETFLMSNAKFFPASKLPYIKEKIAHLPEERQVLVGTLDYKDPTIMLIISIVGGTLGIDRFMLGQVGLGLGKLLTGGGCGLWTIIDWFVISDATKDVNFQKLSQSL